LKPAFLIEASGGVRRVRGEALAGLAADGKLAGRTLTREASVARDLCASTETIPMATDSHPEAMSTPEAAGRLPAVAQAVAAPLTRAAIFLVATLNPGSENRATLRSFCGDLAALLRAVEFRDLEGGISCVMGLGSDAWDRLFGPPRPAALHPFREIRAGVRHAVSTPGDLLFHIRAKRMDLCFELATQIMARIGNAASPVDEVQGFRYFDDRDLLGFVDGTENPRGAAAAGAVLIGDEDADFAGGSYVIIQKYLHDLGAWNALTTEAQERIIGRTKLSDIELDDSVKPTSAHSALTTIVENGKEIKILRDNMPFGRPGRGEFGTYFIGYSRSPRTIEQMLENMFVGRPPGNYDRILDFSRAVTGNLFFVPSATFLENVTDQTTEDQTNEDPPTVTESPAAPAVAEASSSIPSVRDGSLGIGSLKGDIRHE
jgi:putative iron-dependent peroxidase